MNILPAAMASAAIAAAQRRAQGYNDAQQAAPEVAAPPITWKRGWRANYPAEDVAASPLETRQQRRSAGRQLAKQMSKVAFRRGAR